MGKSTTIISKTADMLASVSKFVLGASERPQSSSELRERLGGLDIEALERAVSQLEDSRNAVLIGGTDSELAHLDAEIAAAHRSADRGVALRNELTRLVADAEAREARADRAAKRAEAERLTAAAMEAIGSLPGLFAAIRAVLRAEAVAEIATAAANEGLHHTSPDMVAGPAEMRQRAATEPETILSRKRVALWAFPTDHSPLSQADQAKVVSAGNGTGRLPTGALYQVAAEVVLKDFVRTDRIKAQRHDVPDLATSIILPDLTFNGRQVPGWRGARLSGDPNSRLASLDEVDAEAARREALPQMREVVFEPVRSVA